MKLHSQFLRLHGFYGAEPSVQITLDELALSLECTHRNALNIIRKMEANGWIEWQAKRGRGKRSELIFRIDPEEIAALTMMKAIDRNEIKKVIDDIKTYTNSSKLPERLQGWLMGYFGHHAELDKDNETLDILRLPLRQQLHELDPLRINLLAESFVSSHVFDSLLTLDVETGEIVPHLAHDYDVSDSRKVWTFYVRKDVKFHHGKTLNAEDIIYTFQRLKSYDQPLLYHYVIQSICSIRAVSSTCVEFTLHEANEYFPSFLCTTRASIVPSDLGEEYDSHSGSISKISGTGPFRITEHNTSMCVLEAFSDYFKTRPHLDVVEIIQIPWNLSHEESDISDNSHPLFPIQLGGQAASSQGETEAISHAYVRKLITCNTKKEGPLQDPVIRKKVLSSITWAEIEQSLINNSTTLGNESLHSISGSKKEIDFIQPETDQKTECCTRLVLATIPQYRKDAAAIASQLEMNGYQCLVKIVPVEQFKGPVRMEADLILFSLFIDQDESLRRHDLYLTLSSHVEPALQDIIHKNLLDIQCTRSNKERLKKLNELEQMLINEGMLHILYDKPFETAVLSGVRGIRLGSQGWIDLRHIWFPAKER